MSHPAPTGPDHVRFAQWDAAYVVGALSATDRREFEAHLEECADCRRAVAELAPTVGLLSRLSAEDARRVMDEEDRGPDASTRSGFVELAHVRERRRRTAWWVAAAAAVAILIAAIATPVALSVRQPPAVAMSAVEDVPIEASVALTGVDWGTRIDLRCAYPDIEMSDVPEGGWTYALAVVSTDGEVSTVSTWRAGPGSSARLSAGTALDLDEIAAIEIRSLKGTVLMRYSLPG